MVLPEWLQNQDNVFLVVAVLLLLWLWLLVSRRQEEESHVPERPIALSVEDLGRKVFRYARSHNTLLYRGLFINGSEAHNLLGDMATEYLERRSPQRLMQSLRDLKAEIPSHATFIGLGATEGTKLIIRIKVGEEEQNIFIGSVTKIENAWRLLEPKGGLN